MKIYFVSLISKLYALYQISGKIEEIASLPDHYLVKARNTSHSYYRDFIRTAEVMKSLLTEKEFEFWCAEKMLLKLQPFEEKKFIQYAIETTVTSFFGCRFPSGFKVEAKINPKNDKDVDCQFMDNGYVFNVEVKCSDFVSKEKIDIQDAFKFETVGRLPNRGQEAIEAVKAALIEGLNNKGEPLKSFLTSKKMDLNLKIFLESANEKFNPNPVENEINILLVGCDDAHDLQNWINYLYSHEGLFTKHSFADRRLYQNVDLVVFTNQYFKHNRFFDKRISASWTLQDGFNVVMVNPNRHLKKTDGIRHFLDLLPNYSTELGNYQIPGSAPDEIKETARITYFVKDYLETQMGIYPFESELD